MWNIYPSTPRLKASKTKLATAIAATLVATAPHLAHAATVSLLGASANTLVAGETLQLTVDVSPDFSYDLPAASSCTISGSLLIASGDSSAQEGVDFIIEDNDFSISVNSDGEVVSTSPGVVNITATDTASNSALVVYIDDNVNSNCSFYGGVTVSENFAQIDILGNDENEDDPELNPGPIAEKLAETPGLNRRQAVVADALDQSCALLQSLDDSESDLSAAQAELLTTCNALDVSDNLTRDLDGLSHEELTSMGTLSFQGATVQAQNLSKQIRRIRQGIRGLDLANLQVSIDGQPLSGQQLNRLLGGGAGDGELHSQWGTFLGGSIQVGSYNGADNHAEFDFDVTSLFAGADYQLTKNVMVGGALGYTQSSAEITSEGGESELSGISLAVFGSYYYRDTYYIDGILSLGDSDYSTERHVVVGNTTSLASGDTSGNEVTLALNGGYYLRRKDYFIHLFSSLNYIDARIDSFQEGSNNGTSGSLLAISDQELASLTSNIGVEFGWTINTKMAVISPQLAIDWEHQYRDDSRAVSGRFLGDPSNTVFDIETHDQDRNYFNAGLTLNAMFKGGFSAYTRYEVDLERDDVDIYDLSLGGRWEF